MFKRCSYGFLIFALAVLPLYLRVWSEARENLGNAREARARGNLSDAIVSYRRAISWSGPGNSLSSDAAEELYVFAMGDLPLPLKETALLELKRGLRSSRSFLRPWDSESSRISEINRTLAALQGRGADSVKESSPPQIHYEFQFLAQCAFWGWIAAAFAAIRWGISKEGRVIRAPFARLAMLAGLFYGAWIWCLSLA